MAIHDFRRFEDDTSLETDICIVGSGPAAWTLSDELRDSGLSVLVLESGSALESETDPHDPEADALNATVDTGEPLSNGRRRRLGGTTEVAGWANRTIAFDPIDYEARPWVPHSGWPISADTIAPFLARAGIQLGVGSLLPRPPLLPSSKHWPAFDADQLAPATWVFGQAENRNAVRYALHFRRRHRTGLRILVHATVTQVVTNTAGTQVEGVEITSPDGKRAMVKARAVVLAAGGIENPRLLLCSNRSVSVGLGNGQGLVGRFLMDHPRDLRMAITFDKKDADRLRAVCGPFRMDQGAGPRYVANGFALSTARQRRDKLLNCAAWLIVETAEDDPIEAAKRLARRQGAMHENAKTVLQNAGLLLRATHGRLAGGHALHRKADRIGLVIGSEQQPDPESRVTLADSVDRFGLPLAHTHWRINDIDRASQAALAQTIQHEFSRMGLPHATLAEWARTNALTRASLVDGCHPTGTTRMADDPSLGVVDVNCQVHGVAGLYVAGSSVFPTAGHANPTLMIAAMATRLADHLSVVLPVKAPRPAALLPPPRSENSASSIENDVLVPIWAGATVVVTGASSFLGSRLVECLVAEGAQVICLLCGSASVTLHRNNVETRLLDLADLDAVKMATVDADYVMHCAYDWTDEEWNRRALSSLIEAGRVNRWKRFVHVSSFVVYDMPPSGDLIEDVIDTTAPGGYSRTKLDLEVALMAAFRADGLPATIIQPTLVYGPRSWPWPIDPIDKLTNGTVILPDQGEGVCNAVFVDDVIRAMLLAAQAPGAIGQRFLISGNAVSWRDFYETLARAAGVGGPTYLPRDTIIRKNRVVARLLRGVLTPRLVVRKIAGVGPMRRLMTKLLKRLPYRTHSLIDAQLYKPITRLRGHKYLPDAGELRFLESSAKVDSRKALTMIGYAPRVDLAVGMTIIETYLRERGLHGAETR